MALGRKKKSPTPALPRPYLKKLWCGKKAYVYGKLQYIHTNMPRCQPWISSNRLNHFQHLDFQMLLGKICSLADRDQHDFRHHRGWPVTIPSNSTYPWSAPIPLPCATLLNLQCSHISPPLLSILLSVESSAFYCHDLLATSDNQACPLTCPPYPHPPPQNSCS